MKPLKHLLTFALLSFAVVAGAASRTALVIVDVQYDFLPGGSLAVNEGEAVIAPLIAEMRTTVAKGGVIVTTQDWHPENHVSFKEFGGSWPAHARQETRGAQIHDKIQSELNRITRRYGAERIVTIKKGFDPLTDSYSGFGGFNIEGAESHSLKEELERLGIDQVRVGGLATDYCVKSTAIDAARLGFSTTFLQFASRGVEIHAGDIRTAIADMAAAGVRIQEIPSP